MPTNNNGNPNEHSSTQKVVDTAAKGAAEYFAPGVGGKVYDAAKKVPVVGNQLNKATGKVAKKMDRIPGVKNTARQLDKSGALNAANQGINMMGGNPNIGSQNNSHQSLSQENIAQTAAEKTGSSQQEGVENSKSTPLFNKKKKFSPLSGSEDDNKKKDADGALETLGKLKKYKNYFMAGCGAVGCLGIIAIVIFVILCFWYVGDLFKIDIDLNLSHIGKNISGFVDDVANTFSGCWFQSAADCKATQEEKFFNKVKEVHKNYQTRWGVKLDSALIVSTLTYKNIDDVMNNDNDNDEYSIEDALNLTDASDYRKARKMINALADHMAPIHIETRVTTDAEGNEHVEEVKVRKLDLEAYNTYLREEFLPNFLDVKDESVKETRVERAIEEIYRRVDFYRALLGLDNDSQITYASQCNYNTTRVNVVSCDNEELLATTSLKDYVLGVVYGEVRFSEGNSEEYYKTMIIAAKTYGLARGRYDSTTKSITIKSCTDDQVWCDINTGCYRDEEIANSGRYTVYPMGIELPIANATRKQYAPPLSKDLKEKLSNIYDDVANYLYLDESYNSVITTLSYENELPYNSRVQVAWRDLANEGNDFQTILQLTSMDSRFSEAIMERYSNKKLYDLAEYCVSTGYSGNGNYQLDISSNGSINVNNPIDFFSQYALNNKTIVTFGATSQTASGKVVNRTDDYYIYKYSCGPTSFSMIISAIGNIGYLDEYYSNVSLSGGNNDEKLYVIAKVHRYLADHGLQKYPSFNSEGERVGGGLHYGSLAYNDTIYAPLGIQLQAVHSSGITSQLIYNYLSQGYLMMYNIQGTKCSVKGACGGFGRTSGGHFGVIYGYDAATDEFLVYDPVQTTYAPIRAGSQYVSKLNSITVWGGI